MLAMSLGVAVAGAALAGYRGIFGRATALATLQAFEATFVSMGLITLASAMTFWSLPSEAHSAPPVRSGHDA
jgi:hypothetical protein